MNTFLAGPPRGQLCPQIDELERQFCQQADPCFSQILNRTDISICQPEGQTVWLLEPQTARDAWDLMQVDSILLEVAYAVLGPGHLAIYLGDTCLLYKPFAPRFPPQPRGSTFSADKRSGPSFLLQPYQHVMEPSSHETQERLMFQRIIGHFAQRYAAQQRAREQGLREENERLQRTVIALSLDVQALQDVCVQRDREVELLKKENGCLKVHLQVAHERLKVKEVSGDAH